MGINSNQGSDMTDNTFPAQVFLIRHGEKLGDPYNDDDIPDLSIKGSARAAAIPSLFVPDSSCALSAHSKDFHGSYAAQDTQSAPPRFNRPDFLFATQASKHSNRPLETITPLSLALQLSINDKHDDDDYASVAKDILEHSKYAGQIVLVCWHHGKLPDLAGELGVENPPDWEGQVFDLIWRISYPNGKAELEQNCQMLLFGDSTQAND